MASVGDNSKATEDSFRGSLQDVVGICTKLAPVCTSVDELVGICQLAIDNDAQLKLLMREVLSKR
jgi:hypothetical protein